MDKKAILQQFGYFKGISDKSLTALADICLSKIFEKRQTIFTEGEKGYALFFCINGRIQLYKTTPDGKEVVIKVIKPGEIFGEVILFEMTNYPVTAVALSRSQVFMMSKHQFMCLLESEDFRNDFMATLMRKQRYLADQIKYLISHDVEDRLYLFLKENYGEQESILPAISKKDMAAAIAATPETFSRLLQRLKQEGTLTWDSNMILINKSVWKKLRNRS